MYGITKKIITFVKQLKKIFMGRKKKVTEPQDKRYMLFLYGEFADSEELIHELSTQFIFVASSEYLKFTYGEYGVVLHFRSKETFNDLKEYVDMVFNDITEQYFLIEVSGDFDIKMPKKLKKDFLNIDTFYMTAKFFDAKAGFFIKMMNEPQSNLTGVNQFSFPQEDYFYYKVVLDYSDYTYKVFDTKTNTEIGDSQNPIKWYEYINP